MIKPEEAREALIGMIEKDYDKLLPPLQRELEVLKKEPVLFLDKTDFRIGNWHCDQTDLSFVVTFHDLPMMLECSGIFEMGTDGKWKAVITKTRESLPR